MIVNKSHMLKFVSLFYSGHSDVPDDRPQAWQDRAIRTYLLKRTSSLDWYWFGDNQIEQSSHKIFII